MRDTTPTEVFIDLVKSAHSDTPYCEKCGGLLAWKHDHKDDETGLDDGPWLPGLKPRKKPALKSAVEMREIRKRAWETRRGKYGAHGHR